MKDPSKSNRLPKQHPIDTPTREAAWDELVRILIRGGTHRQAATLLGFHISTIHKWCADERFRVKLRRTRSLVFQRTKDVVEEATEKAEIDIQEKLKAYGRDAIEKMWNMMQTAENERVQLKAAENLADRSAETQKTRKVDVGGSIALFSAEDLVLMAQTAKEIQEDRARGERICPAELNDSLALPIEVEPIVDNR